MSKRGISVARNGGIMSEHVDPRTPKTNPKEKQDRSRRATRRLRPVESEPRAAAEKVPGDHLDPIDEAGEESFPASDPPNWTLGVEPRAKPGKKS
ncbi:MAG TPA: hypothetical protein VH560_04675 [Polyangia bacterium]|jgi:hypothetical protein|nr:hypothetical protein [Polyangia bacterium]